MDLEARKKHIEERLKYLGIRTAILMELYDSLIINKVHHKNELLKILEELVQLKGMDSGDVKVCMELIEKVEKDEYR